MTRGAAKISSTGKATPRVDRQLVFSSGSHKKAFRYLYHNDRRTLTSTLFPRATPPAHYPSGFGLQSRLLRLGGPKARFLRPPPAEWAHRICERLYVLKTWPPSYGMRQNLHFLPITSGGSRERLTKQFSSWMDWRLVKQDSERPPKTTEMDDGNEASQSATGPFNNQPPKL